MCITERERRDEISTNKRERESDITGRLDSFGLNKSCISKDD